MACELTPLGIPGDRVVHVEDDRGRVVTAIMTTFDPDTGEQDVEVLKRIHRELDGTFELNCRVDVPGHVLGDAVRLLD